MERMKGFRGPVIERTLVTGSPAETLELGERLGKIIPPGTVISLEGGLGAGKTYVVKGIIRGLGISSEVLSPTFILVEEYKGELSVLHFDLYRLEDLGDVERLGLFDAIDGRNIVLVEWGDRLPGHLLDHDIRILINVTGDVTRKMVIEAPGDLLEILLEET